jgi:hypothetical protein
MMHGQKNKQFTINCIQVAGVGAGVEDKMFHPSRNLKSE